MMVSFKHTLPNVKVVKDRANWIVDRCRGQRVLHIGCVDTGMTSERINKGQLLHALLEISTSGIVGVDINKEGIIALQEFGFRNVYCLNIELDALTIIEKIKIDLGGCEAIICGEVLEHVLDVGNFLAGVKLIAGEFASEVIFSVPNAYSIRGIIGLLTGEEIVHSDHNCYYSWKTLTITLRKSGFEAIEFLTYANEGISDSAFKNFMKKIFNKTIFKKYPFLAEGLIAVAEVRLD